ncbi:hypothetical protein NDN08_001659 [Rhodosorus marinus]|uniref:Uncharacterized protein n=1 Tax=Rhodosorus marinus TaxID=101924 RepID=A0AAV8URF6_9RHOD|nr:hypothetical protein NDN08_001659 [Rhodosorus marinus]
MGSHAEDGEDTGLKHKKEKKEKRERKEKKEKKERKKHKKEKKDRTDKKHKKHKKEKKEKKEKGHDPRGYAEVSSDSEAEPEAVREIEVHRETYPEKEPNNPQNDELVAEPHEDPRQTPDKPEEATGGSNQDAARLLRMRIQARTKPKPSNYNLEERSARIDKVDAEGMETKMTEAMVRRKLESRQDNADYNNLRSVLSRKADEEEYEDAPMDIVYRPLESQQQLDLNFHVDGLEDKLVPVYPFLWGSRGHRRWSSSDSVPS